jgi:Protein of unknown function (DUF2971)
MQLPTRSGYIRFLPIRPLERVFMRFFKYVTADIARTILENGTLRFSSPAMFNDPFDTQFDLHLEFDEATIIDLVLDEFWKIFSGQKILEPANRLGHVLELFLARERGLTPDEIFRRHEHQIRDAVAKSIAEAKTRITAFHGRQRLLLRNARLLCLSEVHDNILMWSHYAQNHSGAVLEFDSDERKDSPFKMAERVVYSKTMPRLMNEKQMVQFLSGQWRMNPYEIMHNEIFVKADDWSYEKEWRIWLPDRDADRDFIYIQFDREELVGIYFGCRMSEQHRTALLDTLIKHFPNASACQARKSAREFSLQFDRIR